MTIVLGIDLATSDVRVQAFDVETGARLVERTLPLAGNSTGGRHTQPARHGELARRLVAAVAADLGGRVAEVRGLSITGTSGSVVPVDASGTPVGDVVLYDDPRGSREQRLLADAGLGDRPSAALARAAWMHANAPAARYVFTPDVVAAALAGRLLPSDTSHALKSGIDPVAATWNLPALLALGLPPECLPELVAPGRVIGEVSDPGPLGLPGGVAIVSGMTDGSTGQIATGAVGEGDTVGVLGTTLVLKAVSPVDVVDGATGVYSHVSPDGLFWPGGASNTGAGVLRTGSTSRRDPALQMGKIEEFGPSGIVTYPLARNGERFPVASKRFVGFSVDLEGRDREPADAIGRFRAVYEGVAFVERLGLERLSDLGVERRRHHLAGGAAASALWNRLRASALGRPVIVTEGAGSARGAAVLAASGVGCGPLGVLAERFAGRQVTVDPDLALAAALDERYAVFLAALRKRVDADG